MGLPIKTSFTSRVDLLNQLKTNPGLIIIKFGAEWCGPCKRIDPTIDDWFTRMPNSVQCYMIDVDECFDVYAYLKQKKMVPTIPTLLCYIDGNYTYIPDLLISSSDVNQVNAFFTKCLQKIK
jgi:thiol-disulfide isomerase/thioredoxin